MKLVRASMTLAMVLGAALTAFAGCEADPVPVDSPTGGNGNGGSGGGNTSTTCGDGKLEAEKGEVCDDGNNVGGDGCTSCNVDVCYTCVGDAGGLSTCSLAAAGATCPDNKVCDGAGSCVECVDNAQCTDGYCHLNVCAKCTDGVKNGDETDMDCGGANCGKCDNGKACKGMDDCTSTFCVDGVCCIEACDGVCLSCNIAGSEGVCDAIPKYEEDLSFGAGESCTKAMGKVCTGAAGCASALGEPCQSPGTCASLKCGDPDADGNKTCVKNTGDACTDNVECFTNTCDPTTMKCT